MVIAPNRNVTEHFSYADCVCPCCKTLIVDELFYAHMRLLEKLRMTVGFPISINSAHRCKAHNDAISDSATNSMHLKFATDVRPSDNDPKKLIRIGVEAEKVGFTGIGTYNSFRHLDCRPIPARWNG